MDALLLKNKAADKINNMSEEEVYKLIIFMAGLEAGTKIYEDAFDAIRKGKNEKMQKSEPTTLHANK